MISQVILKKHICFGIILEILAQNRVSHSETQNYKMKSTIKLQDLKIKTIQVNPNDDVANNTNLNDGGYTWVE